MNKCSLGQYFWKHTKKVIDRQKHHFGRFWRLITVFLCVFKNTDQNNICGSIVFKAKTKEKYEEIFFYGFYFKNQKCFFLRVNQFFFKFFSSSVLAFNTIDTQMLFIYIYIYIIYIQKKICASIVFKAESKTKHEEKIVLGGFSLKTKNALFIMVLFKSQISNLYFCGLFLNVKGSSMPIFIKKY